MRAYETQGYYGGGHTPCTVFVYEYRRNGRWYCVEDSVNVNLTCDNIDQGVDVETLSDIDCFTWNTPINSLDELIEAVEG